MLIIHQATDVVPKKKHTGEYVIKPETIFSYTNLMRGVDLSDQYLISFLFLKMSMQW